MSQTANQKTLTVTSDDKVAKNPVLKLKKMEKKVSWTEETVDNEFLGKKRSNICCIYNPRRVEDRDEVDRTCSSDEGNELERSMQTKKEHLKICKKLKNHKKS